MNTQQRMQERIRLWELDQEAQREIDNWPPWYRKQVEESVFNGISSVWPQRKGVTNCHIH